MRLSIGTELRASAFLFDMDGTLVNSIAAVERVWRRWADGLGLDGDAVIHACHGRRPVETVRDFIAPDADPEAEEAWLNAAEYEETEGILAIPGAAELLAELPPERWAIVTSAHRALARRRLSLAGLPCPKVLIAAEDVSRGKPEPEGYLSAAGLLGAADGDAAANGDAIVFEDAPAGLAAGRAAGFRTIAMATIQSPERLAEWDWIPDLSVLAVDEVAGSLKLTVRG